MQQKLTFRHLSWAMLVVAFCAAPASLVFAQEKKDSDKEKSEEITLERLFPKDSLFGPSASDTDFSADGRYAAFLYRPRLERRHGNDLWLYDFKEKELKRITDVSVMAEFQKSARLVANDRLSRYKKDEEKKEDDKDKKVEDKKKKSDKKDEEKQKEQDREIITTVKDDDADADHLPRYSGIQGYQWHPEKNAMLVFSGGDVYQIGDVDEPTLERLTQTMSRESQVDYLPDGSGYTYSVDGAVQKIEFGSHLIHQLNPDLPSGVSMSNYELSPDGTKLLMVARSGGRSASDRRVDIIRYRDRFAKADSISRTVSDDATKPQDLYVYLYDLSATDTEEGDLIEVYHTQSDEPRDVLTSPHWSPDSTKVTFAEFDQETAEVHIHLAQLPDAEELKKLRSAEAKKQAEEWKKNAKKGDDDESGTRWSMKTVALKHDSKVVYRFKHDGGPNTPRMVSPDWSFDSKHIVFVSELSGFRHVHKLDPLYESVQQVTSGYYEVYPEDFSKDHRYLFVTATKDSPAQTMVYSIDLESGEMKKLSKNDGTYSNVAVSDDGEKLLARYVTYGQLTELVAQDAKGKVEVLTDSHSDEAKALTQWEPEFFDYENRHGHKIHGMMFKPDGWKKDKKYPLLIYVYGGPLGTSKSVTDGSYSSDGYFFQGFMAKKHNYLTVVIDPRGQSGYGGLFEKSNYERVGKPQVEDLVDGVKHLQEEFTIDSEKVGIFGWSFGGFQTQMCLYTEPEVFKVGMAGAGPTEWENYNSWYTTGTVGPSRTGSPDQKKYSLRPLAKNLKGKMLLVHGMEDTNVLFQDTVAIYRELLKAGKETNVELFLDPTGGHGLGGDVKRIGRMRKYEEFLLRTIGEGPN